MSTLDYLATTPSGLTVRLTEQGSRWVVVYRGRPRGYLLKHPSESMWWGLTWVLGGTRIVLTDVREDTPIGALLHSKGVHPTFLNYRREGEEFTTYTVPGSVCSEHGSRRLHLHDGDCVQGPWFSGLVWQTRIIGATYVVGHTVYDDGHSRVSSVDVWPSVDLESLAHALDSPV